MTSSSVSVQLSKMGSHLVFIQNTFDEFGMLEETKKAAMPISPDFDPEEVLAKAKTLAWELHGEPDDQGFCKVRKAQHVIEDKQ